MTDKTKALLARFAVGCVLAELPILVGLLNAPNPDWRFAAAGLLGGLAAYLEKNVTFDLAPPPLVLNVSPDVPPVMVLTPPASPSAPAPPPA